jgi:hypothetical protein
LDNFLIYTYNLYHVKKIKIVCIRKFCVERKIMARISNQIFRCPLINVFFILIFRSFCVIDFFLLILFFDIWFVKDSTSYDLLAQHLFFKCVLFLMYYANSFRICFFFFCVLYKWSWFFKIILLMWLALHNIIFLHKFIYEVYLCLSFKL